MGEATQAAEVIARNSVKLKEHGCHLAGRRQRANCSAPENPTLGQIRKAEWVKQEEGNLCR
jgi:hypothetical protein